MVRLIRNLLLTSLLLFSLFGQSQERKNYFPAWSFEQRDANIHGLSFGLTSIQFNHADFQTNSNTNGVKVEAFGGLLFLLFWANSGGGVVPESDSVFQRKNELDPIKEKVNGVNFSLTGPFCNCRVNGFSLGTLALFNTKVNGVSFSLLNFVMEKNGIQLALSNGSYKLNGLQLGLFNKSVKLKGIQIGLWNKNQKRSLPFINWNFKG